MSNGFDPDQDRQNVGPDLGPNCLQRLSEDYKLSLAQKELKSKAENLEEKVDCRVNLAGNKLGATRAK